MIKGIIENTVEDWYKPRLQEGFDFTSEGDEDNDALAAAQGAMLMHVEKEFTELMKDHAKWRGFYDEIVVPAGLGRSQQNAFECLFEKTSNGAWDVMVATPADTRITSFAGRMSELREIAGEQCIRIVFDGPVNDTNGSYTFGALMKHYYGSYTFNDIIEKGGWFCDSNWNKLNNAAAFAQDEGREAGIYIKTSSGICIEVKIGCDDTSYYVSKYAISLPVSIIHNPEKREMIGKIRAFAENCVEMASSWGKRTTCNYTITEQEMEEWPDAVFHARYGHDVAQVVRGVAAYFGHPGKISGNLNWIDTSDCTYVSRIFENMEIGWIDVSRWNLKNCTTVEQLFMGAKCKGEVDLSNWKFERPVNMSKMFMNADIAKVVMPDDIDFSDASRESVASMFENFSGSFGDISKWRFNDSNSRWSKTTAPFPFANCEWAARHKECMPKKLQKYSPKITLHN